MTCQVFLVTGTSSGFGAELVKKCLAEGGLVVATSRKPEQLAFDQATESNFLAVKLDVTSTSSIEDAFAKAVDKFGRVDVVVNNAGYGLAGVFESLTEDRVRKQFEINYFGLAAVTRKALSVMREQQPCGGHIIQVTSIGGQVGFPFFSQYNATKWAAEGFTEALSHELKPEWRVRLTCVEPGDFRTNWAGGNIIIEDPHPAYDHLDVKYALESKDGKQPGDPVKAAGAMWQLASMADPPLRIALGSDAYARMQKKLKDYTQQLQLHESLSKSTDFDQ